MYDLKTILLAKRFRRNLDITHLTVADIAMLEIIKNKTASNPVHNATITNGIATFGGVVVSQPLVSLLLNLPVTQTGSGTPSPDNVRDFIGVSGVNIGQTSGYAPYFRGLLNGTYSFADLGTLRYFYDSSNNRFYSAVQSYIKPNGNSVVANAICPKYPTYKVIDQIDNTIAISNDSRVYIKDEDYTDVTEFTNSLSGVYLIYELAEPSTPVTPQEFATLCQAFGITGNTYQINFGQTVYSAYLDVLNGKLYLIDEIKTIDENSGVQIADNGILYLNSFFEIDEDTESINCNVYQRGENRGTVAQVNAYNPDLSFCCKLGTNADRLMIKDTRFTSTEDYNTWLSTNPVKIAVKLAEPIEIDLTPTIINTLIGENVIFADVADVTECKFTRK